jgi:hypothetical protein
MHTSCPLLDADECHIKQLFIVGEGTIQEDIGELEDGMKAARQSCLLLGRAHKSIHVVRGQSAKHVVQYLHIALVGHARICCVGGDRLLWMQGIGLQGS